jgi:hypothetical protein
MRVLLDEQLPRHLAREIGGHDVSTVQQRGWAGLKNGNSCVLPLPKVLKSWSLRIAIFNFSKTYLEPCSA